MATVIMTKPASRLDPSVKKKAYAFLEKLGEDDTAPGLHIEPIAGAVDPRVRTGRVDLFYRAVLFKVPRAGSATYIFHGIWPHDDAIEVAKKTSLKLNPVTGIAEIVTSTAQEPEPAAPAVPEAPAAGREPEPAAEPLLASLGITRETLVGELGIDPALADAALAATDDDGVLALIDDAVEWQSLVLLELAAGHSVAEVRDAFSLTPDGPAEGASEEEQLLAGLQHPAARLTFTWIESNEELRRVIEDGDFGAWRVFLHPEQKRYVNGDYNGPFRLSGGAGTGKTVVLLHRARRLMEQNPQARMLVTTFTTNLAEQMRRDLERLDPAIPFAARLGDPGVHVVGIDALANAVLQQAGSDIAVDVASVLGQPSTAVTGRTPNSVWQTVIADAGEALPEQLRSEVFFAAEYAAVVLPNQITDRQQYLRARRPGRGVRLHRASRVAVWDVIERYRNLSRIDGTIDFAEAATIAAAHCRRLGESGLHHADHVLVDEGQDLSPAHWQLLRALTAEGRNDMFIAEDSHQRIYGQRLVLGSYGIRIVGRSQRLTLNYRTTAQNLLWAVGVLRGGEFVDLEEGLERSDDYRSARSGPEPRMLASASLGEELDRAAEIMREWLAQTDAPETLAILVRYVSQRDRVVTGLSERGVPVRAVDRGAIKPGQPVVMTMHRAKGTEFSRVLLFGVNEGSIPGVLREQRYSEDAAADALLRERSLLYVAATRARDELAVSWSGTASEFLTRN